MLYLSPQLIQDLGIFPFLNNKVASLQELCKNVIQENGHCDLYEKYTSQVEKINENYKVYDDFWPYPSDMLTILFDDEPDNFEIFIENEQQKFEIYLLPSTESDFLSEIIIDKNEWQKICCFIGSETASHAFTIHVRLIALELHDLHYEDSHFWDSALYQLEGTVWWFYLFDVLTHSPSRRYLMCHQVDQYETETINEMIITLKCSMSWIRYLTKKTKLLENDEFGTESLMRLTSRNLTLGSLYDDKYKCNTLMQCGDIESNPGPVMSKMTSQIFGIETATNGLKELNDFLNNDLKREVEEVIANIMNLTDQRINDINLLTNIHLQEFKDIAIKSLDDFRKIKNKTIQFMSLILLSVFLFKTGYEKTAIFSVISAILISFDVPAKLLVLFNKYEEEKLSQSGSEGSEETQMIKTVGLLSSFFLLDKIPSSNQIQQLCRSLDNYSKGLRGAKNLWAEVGNIWKTIKTWLDNMIYRIPDELKSQEEQIIKWVEKIAHYSDLVIKKKAMLDIDQSLEITNLYKQGITFRKWAYQSRSPLSLVQLINSNITTAQQLYTYAEKNNTLDGGLRVKPLCITLFGESQIGKSTVVLPLAHDIMIEAGMRDEKKMKQQIYARQAETEFWDGYQNQFCIIYDDALATKDDAANPNVELAEMIRTINIFPHHLHMASLEDKNTYNTSELVILTVNDINAKISSLTYEDAFYNRIFDNCYEVVPKKEFRETINLGGGQIKIKLDKNKLKQHLLTLKQPVSLEIYEFYKYKRVIINGKAQIVKEEIPALDFKSFSALMQRNWRENKMAYQDRNVFLENRIKERILEAQIGEDEFHDSENFSLNWSGLPTITSDESFDDYIARNLTFIDGFANLAEIENAILSSDRAVEYADRLQLIKATSPPIRNYIYEIRTIFSEWYKRANLKLQSLINLKFPIFKYISIIMGVLSIGGVAYAFYTKYSSKNIRKFIINDELTREELNSNLEYLAFNRSNLTDKEHNDLFGKCTRQFKNLERREMESEIVHSSPDIREVKVKQLRSEIVHSSPDVREGRVKQLRSEGAIYSSEGVKDANCLELGMNILQNNLYSMEVIHNNKTAWYGNVLFIKGYVILMPRHFIRELVLSKITNGIVRLSRTGKAGKEFTNMIEFPTSELVNSDLSLNRVVEINNKDGSMMDAVLCLPDPKINKIHAHADITKHFITEDLQQKMVGEANAYIFGYSRANNVLSSHLKEARKVFPSTVPFNISSVKNEIIEQRDGYDYIASTIKGDCGGMVLIRSKIINRKIIAMHVAGNTNEQAYGVRLNVEILERHLKLLTEKFGFVSQVALHINNEITDETNEAPDGIFPSFGKVSIPLYSSSKTKLTPSILYNKLRTSITQPALLFPFIKDGQIIDPGRLGLEKCGVNTVLINPAYIKWAKNCVAMKLNINTKELDIKSYCRTLTYEEAVQGTDDDYMGPINRSSSPGYPFNSDPFYKNNKKGKSYWLGFGEAYEFDTKAALELRKLVDDLENDCSNGIISGVICADTKKDERRPIEKVKAGKTRMFSACPMHYVILFRKYFLGFSAWIMHNRNANDISVGTNVYSSEWDFIARKLQRKGQHVIAGDFSNFDGSLNNAVMWAIFDIVNEWYKRYDADIVKEKIRFSLWVHLVNSVHIYENNLYQWTHSQPSGNPFTVILNSIYNCLIMRISYLVVMEKIDLSLCNMKSFEKHVSMVCYGDDNCLNISNEIIELYNQKTITNAMDTLGHTYTDEAKQVDGAISRTLTDIRFLKRNFIKHSSDTVYVAPLAIEVIYDMINWVRENEVDPNELLRTNIETSLMEMSLHGEEIYNNYVKELLSIEEIYDLGVQIMSYAENRFKIEHCDHLGVSPTN